MKKILFLLVLIYSTSFAYDLQICPTGSFPKLSSTNTGGSTTDTQSSVGYSAPYYLLYKKGAYMGYNPTIRKNFYSLTIKAYTCQATLDAGSNENIADGNEICKVDGNNVTCNINPDPLQNGASCRDLFQKDGVAYTCNPNTNEATPIPNSDGTILDPESPNGNDKPNCNSGYEAVGTMTIAGGGNSSYNSWSCLAIPTTPPPTDTGTTPTVTTNANGSKTWVSPDGNTYNLETNGTLTTTYSDGSTSVKQVGSGYEAGTSGGSSGGSGSSGGGTGGKSGNTTNEDNAITPPTDTPIDNTPVANSCNDSALTLQEKMLCELNVGMKKQNSENAPENSLNQLMKDLKTSNQTDNTAMNTNLKDIKSLNENQLNKQTEANKTLENIKDSANGTELYTKVMNEGMNKLVNNTQDAEGKSYLGTITDFVKTLTTPVSGDDKSSYSNQINSNVNSSLGSTLSKYSNVLGFGSAYANRPENITMTIFNQQYTLIDFSILDSYISMIRSLFLTLAYLYGFMNLIRSSN